MKKEIVVVDYGAGNLWSIQTALEYLGVSVCVTDKPRDIERSKCIVLPGVGSYATAMNLLRETKIDEAVKYAVKDDAKILGICLGMQLLGYSSTENGVTKGLGLTHHTYTKFEAKSDSPLKIPHIGFNQVNFSQNTGFFRGIKNNLDYYFVHSYRTVPGKNELAYSAGYAIHGEKFIACFNIGNVYGTQFHPEKSQMPGLKLLQNFVEDCFDG